MFQGIIGHGRVKTFLARSIATDRVAQAYLFVGPRGVGKMAVARAFAETLLHGGRKPQHTLEAHPDVTFVSWAQDEKTGIQKSVITIEQIRGLCERLSYSSLLPSWKIAIVDEAGTMTIEAANAFLKTLEEPRGKTLIMLLASDLRRVPQTVQSRAQVIRFGLVPRRELVTGLGEWGVSKQRAEAVSQIARGRPGAALSLALDKDALGNFQSAVQERSALLARPVYQHFQWIERRAKKKEGFDDEFRLWRELLRDELVVAIGAPELATFGQQSINSQMSNVRCQMSGVRCQVSRLGRLMESEDALRHHIDPRLALEHFLCI